MNKETLMKLSKEELIDALMKTSEANISLNQSLTKIEKSMEFIFLASELINANNNKSKEEIKSIRSIFEEIRDNSKNLKDYFESSK